MFKQHDSGFTLIELAITVAIIGILAAIALPAYQGYVQKARRSDAMIALHALQFAQEKYRAGHFAYAGSTAALGESATSPEGHYALEVGQATASGYVLSAQAATGSPQAQDKGCSTLTLTQSGAHTTRGPAACWQQ